MLPKRKALRWFRLMPMVALVAVALAAQARYRVAVAVGDSILPDLHTGDLLVLDTRAYRQADPQRGDIVLARYDQETIVKRVVGLPGEEVALRARPGG